MPNLDRFSRPLTGERFPLVIPQDVIEEMRIEMQYSIIMDYCWNHIDEYNDLPEAENVIEAHQDIYLDSDLVTETIQKVREMWT